jgi:hypothetical protein
VVHAAIGVSYPVVLEAARPSVRIGGVDRPDAEQPFKAADYPADCAADDRSDRPRCVHAD